MKNKSKLKGFTLIECIVGLAIIMIIAAFLLPSLSNVLNIDRKTTDDKELINYSKHITESIKRDIYNKKDVDIDNDLKEKFDFEYDIENIGEISKLEVTVWRKEYEEEKIFYELLLPEKN